MTSCTENILYAKIKDVALHRGSEAGGDVQGQPDNGRGADCRPGKVCEARAGHLKNNKPLPWGGMGRQNGGDAPRD